MQLTNLAKSLIGLAFISTGIAGTVLLSKNFSSDSLENQSIAETEKLDNPVLINKSVVLNPIEKAIINENSPWDINLFQNQKILIVNYSDGQDNPKYFMCSILATNYWSFSVDKEKIRIDLSKYFNNFPEDISSNSSPIKSTIKNEYKEKFIQNCARNRLQNQDSMVQSELKINLQENNGSGSFEKEDLEKVFNGIWENS